MSDHLLEVYHDGRRVQTARVGPEGLAIGRDPTNGLILDDRMVSAHHARVSLEDGQLRLTDLGSTRGTQLNGRRVTAAVLVGGDELRIGPFTIRLAGTPVTARPPAAPPPQPQPAESTATRRLATGRFRALVKNLHDHTALVGITDLQSVLEALLEHTMHLLDATSGYVLLQQKGTLSSVLARHGSPEKADEKYSQTVCRMALGEKSPILLTDPASFSATSLVAKFGGTPPAMVLAIPLVYGDDGLGVLYMESNLVSPRAKDNDSLLRELGDVGGRALHAALERRQIVEDHQRMQWLAALASEEPDLFRSSQSAVMRAPLEIVRRAANEDITVLIRGESGTGKEVTARTIHRLSARRNGPFAAINCGAIPRDLMEAELFGHEKGAFTGATSRKPGRLELSQGGTLLLDEIGDLPRELQVKLLRVLESRTFTRVGGNEQIYWDARLLCATNTDLEAAVARGDFRSDLYYRINVVSLVLPALRERIDDIEPLVNEILLVSNRRFRRKLFGVAPDALAALAAYSWPGNVRELRNVIERAFILESSDVITRAVLPFPEASPATAVPPPIAQPPGSPPVFISMAEFLTRQEMQYLQLVLDHVGGSVTHAARVLGLSRTALHRRLRQLGMRGSHDS